MKIVATKKELIIQKDPKDAVNVLSLHRASIKLKKERVFASKNSHPKQGVLVGEAVSAQAHLVSAKQSND